MPVHSFLFITLFVFIPEVVTDTKESTLLPILRRISEEETDKKRHIESENFKPSIIGSFYYDPLSNDFNISTNGAAGPPGGGSIGKPDDTDCDPDKPGVDNKTPRPPDVVPQPPDAEPVPPETEPQPPEPEPQPPEPQPPETEPQPPEPEPEGQEPENPDQGILIDEEADTALVRQDPNYKHSYVFTRFKPKKLANVNKSSKTTLKMRMNNVASYIRRASDNNQSDVAASENNQSDVAGNVTQDSNGSPGRRWLEWLQKQFFRRQGSYPQNVTNTLTTTVPTSSTTSVTTNVTLTAHQAYLERIKRKLLKILQYKNQLKMRLKNVLGKNNTI